MTRNVTAYTAPGVAPNGKVAAYVSINGEDDHSILLHARDADGGCVTVAIPLRQTRRMIADLFAWQFPHRESMLKELGLVIGLDEPSHDAGEPAGPR